MDGLTERLADALREEHEAREALNALPAQERETAWPQKARLQAADRRIHATRNRIERAEFDALNVLLMGK